MEAFEKLFGRTYSTVGNSDSDFIIKTRGQVKIQWGKKFIDIIKDGKLNINVDFIKTIDKVSDIVSDGIYYVNEDGTVVIKIKDVLINLSDDGSGSYVSFALPQTTTEYQKATALANIGLRYPSLTEAIAAGIEDGIIFDDETLRWYIVKGGVFSRYPAEIENPYPNQFVIQKTDDNAGALVIKGEGKGNSVAIGDSSKLFIYRSANNTYFNNDSGSFIFQVAGEDVVTISDSEFIVVNPAIFNSTVQSDTFMSANASSNYGFRLYMNNGKSILEVDKLIVRDQNNSSIEVTYSELVELIDNGNLVPATVYKIIDFQNEWELTLDEQLVTEDVQKTDAEGNLEWEDADETIPVIEEYKNVHPLLVTALSPVSIDTSVKFFDNQEWLAEYDITYNAKVRVPEYDSDTGGYIGMVETTSKGRITKLTDEKGNSCNYDFKHLRFRIVEEGIEKWVYTFRDGLKDLSLQDTCINNILTLNNYARERQQEDGIVVVVNTGNYIWLSGTLTNNILGTINSNFEFNGTMTKLRSYGTLTNTILRNYDAENDTVSPTSIEDCEFHSLTNVVINKPIKHALFHNNISNINLTEELYPLLYNNDKVKDVYYNNSKVEVVCIPDLANVIFPGAIIMYSGVLPVPEGWHICDGTEGTPNLIGSFIKADSTAGPSDDTNSMDYPLTIDKSNVPTSEHTHTTSAIEQSLTITIPEHKHSLLYTTTSKKKRVETGDGQGASNYHFSGLGSIYKDNEQWSGSTGLGGIATGTQWDGSALVSSTALSGTATIPASSGVTGNPSIGTDRSLEIKPPRHYSLIFIMKMK